MIFDMDGCCSHNETLAARAWDDSAIALGRRFDGALALALVGRNFADCAGMIRAHYGTDYRSDALLARLHATYDGIVDREGLL